jgi:hypothetical protein
LNAGSRCSQKQDEHNILLQHFANQSDSIKLKQKMWESELAMKEKMFVNDAKQKKMDRYYETMKKRLELEKLGAKKKDLDKLFPLSPLDAKE